MSSYAGSLDANILLRLIINDVPEQTTIANNLLQNNTRFYVADTAIIEVIFVLERYYEISRPEITTYLQLVIANPKLSLNRPLLAPALDFYRSHPKLSFEDCCLAVYAELNAAIPLWTFDKKLASQLKKHTKALS